MLKPSEMNLRLRRNDLHTMGNTNRNCLKVLPSGKHSRQKVCVGDNTGSVSCFKIGKHNELQLDFKTPQMPKPVTRIELFQDQVFAAFGDRVCAYTKKGRQFFVLETNLTECIQSIGVSTPHLFVGGEYVLTQFQEATEKGFFLAPDKINDLLINSGR